MTLDTILTTKSKNSDKNFIVRLLEFSRKNYPNSISFFDELIEKIESDTFFRLKFKDNLHRLFQNVDIIGYLVNSGILQEDSVLSIFKKKISDIILPQIENDDKLNSIINDIFYNQKNYLNLKIIPKDRWLKLMSALYTDNPDSEDELNQAAQRIKSQLSQALTIISDRISGGFSDREMMRYNKDSEYTKSTYNVLAYKIDQIINSPSLQFDYLSIKSEIAVCKNQLHDILIQKDYKGISLKVSTKINRLQQQLDRLRILLSNLNDLNQKGSVEFLVNAIKNWIEFYAPKNWVSNQLSSTVYQITFMATYHNGKTGEKYITSNAKEYFKMFYTAAAGGFIVAILCFIKVNIGNSDSSPFTHAFLYSLNYAIGFITIYLMHWTLATKQPAMTAARLSRAFLPKEGENSLNIKEFTNFFAQLSRSQFIAFMGNVIFGFLVAFGIYNFLDKVLNIDLIKYSKALHFYEELYTFDWQIFYFAAVAGVFLFVSGLVSGLTINRQRYNNVTNRIYNHPTLKKIFSSKKRRNISQWFERNYGGVIGNLAFGFMMGSAFLIGKFLGIPFDIRHITFSAGNLAIGICGIGYVYEPWKLTLAFIAIFGIGFFNFIVSFGLSLMLAMRSNNIPLYKIFYMAWHSFKEFLRSPFKFFLPPIWNKKEQIQDEKTRKLIENEPNK